MVIFEERPGSLMSGIGDAQERLDAARDYFLSPEALEESPSDLKIRLAFAGHKITICSQSDLQDFDVRAFSPTLDASVSLESPLDKFLRDLICQRLLEVADPGLAAALSSSSSTTSFAIRKGFQHYPLGVLYEAAELLCKGLEEDAGCSAILVALPSSFPYTKLDGENVKLEGLKQYLLGEAQYFANDMSEQALRKLELAVSMEPENAMFVHRLASCESRLGRNKSAMRRLAEQQRLTPTCGMLYWRLGKILIHNYGRYENVLVTLHGGQQRHGLGKTRAWGRLLRMARKSIVHLFGARALSSDNAAVLTLTQGVLHMVLLKLTFWDALRVAQVCLSWSIFGRADSLWRRYLKLHFPEETYDATEHKKAFPGVVDRFRFLVRSFSHVMEVQTPAWTRRNEGNGGSRVEPKFRVFQPPHRDDADVIWRAFISYLRKIGIDATDYPLGEFQGTYFSLPGLVLGDFLLSPCMRNGLVVNLLPREGLFSFCQRCSHHFEDMSPEQCTVKLHTGQLRRYDSLSKKEVAVYLDSERVFLNKMKGSPQEMFWTCCKSSCQRPGCTTAKHSSPASFESHRAAIYSIENSFHPVLECSAPTELNKLPSNGSLLDWRKLPFETEFADLMFDVKLSDGSTIDRSTFRTMIHARGVEHAYQLFDRGGVYDIANYDFYLCHTDDYYKFRI